MTGHEHLAWLRARRSVRAFTGRPVARDALARLVEAAISAPSSSNRQPWRFAVVTAPGPRRAIAEVVRARAQAIGEVVRRGPHGEEFGTYGDFFWEPLAGAAAIVVPQAREHADLLARFIVSAGADPADFELPGAMQPEVCALGGAVMAMLLQARAEELGACWMAGPMVARREIERLLDIAPPWRMAGAIAVGHPVAAAAPSARKPLAQVVSWFEEDR